MPDVLWSLRQSKTAEAFDQDVRDITNFLDYVGEPAKLVRVDLAILAGSQRASVSIVDEVINETPAPASGPVVPTTE